MSLVAPPDVTVSAEPSEIAVSPDGGMVAFIATDSNGLRRIWLRSLDSLMPQPLSGTDDAGTPFWSPDGRNLAFFADSKLKKVPSNGGAAVTLADAPDSRGGSWGSSGEIVFGPSSGGPLMRVDENGGAVSPATRLDKGEIGHRFPSFLPDGRRFLYVAIPGRENDLAIRLGSLDGEPQPGEEVATGSGAAVYAAPGYLLYGRRDAVVAQSFDPKSGRVAGSPVALREVPNVTSHAAGAPAVSVSRNGVLVQSPSGFAQTRLLWLDRRGQVIGSLAAPPASYADPTISPDGTRLLVLRSSSEGFHLWQIDGARGVATRMTFDSRFNFWPTWSPDGRRFVFASDRGGTRNIYLRDASGAGTEEILVKLEGLFNHTTDWSGDGSTILLRRLDPATREDIWILPFTGDRKPVPFLRTPFNEEDARFSPDGRWIAYRSDESGRSELYVQSFPTGGARVRVSTNGAGEFEAASYGLPVWTRDGKELIFLGGDGVTVMAAPIRAGATAEVGSPSPLFTLPAGTVVGVPSPDGSRYLACVTVPGTVASTARAVIGWTAELEKK